MIHHGKFFALGCCEIILEWEVGVTVFLDVIS